MAGICRRRGWRDSPGRRTWGVGVLYSDRFIVPRAALVGAFFPVIEWGLILLAAVAFENPALASSFPAFPMAVASLFNLVIAAVVALHLRHAAESPAENGTEAPERQQKQKQARQTPAYRYLSGLMVGAIAVSALTTPALAATDAGRNNPHANHTFHHSGGCVTGVNPGAAFD